MPYILGDIFIGNYPITQAFGSTAEKYAALYGLKGHNGTDFAAPTGTMVLSAADGFVSEIGFDSGGYGKYLKVVHNGYLTLYGHLNDIVVNEKDRVVAGQLIAHSNNTGFSTGSHLHFGVAPCDANGVKTDKNNGYSGYIDPNGDQCQWEVKNLTSPVVQNSPDTQKPPVSVSSDEYVLIVAQGTNYKVIADFLIKRGMNDYLGKMGQQIIDINNNPKDPDAGTRAVSFIASLFDEIGTLKQQTSTTTTYATSGTNTGAAAVQAIDTALAQATPDEKASFFSSVFGALKSFIFSAK